MKIDIRDGIPDAIAVECVMHVVRQGKISTGENGKKYYCWGTLLQTPIGNVVVATRQYRKDDCFVVYKQRQNEQLQAE